MPHIDAMPHTRLYKSDAPRWWWSRRCRRSAGITCIAASLLASAAAQSVLAQPNVAIALPLSSPQSAIDVAFIKDLDAQGSLRRFIVTGQDPHLIFPLQERWLTTATDSSTSDQRLELPMAVSVPKPLTADRALVAKAESTISQSPRIADGPHTIKIELFFKVLAVANEQYATDPWYRLLYSMPLQASQPPVGTNTLSTNRTGLVLSLPAQIVLAPDTLIRLDLDGCVDCSITLLDTTPRRTPNKESSARSALKPHRVMNGIAALNTEARHIAPTQWALRNVSPSDLGLIPLTGDPYIVSPHLDLAANSVGGLGIALSARRPQSSGDVATDTSSIKSSETPVLYEFQVFHSDNLHGFDSRASSHFKLWMAPHAVWPSGVAATKASTHCDHRVFIPLAHISQETSDTTQPLVLDQLRLDLPADTALAWHVCDTWVVPINHQSAELEYQPKLLIHQRPSNVTGLALFQGIIANLLRDWLFIVMLFILVLLIVWRTSKALKR